VKARLDAPDQPGDASLPPASESNLVAAKAVALLLLGEDPASERIRAAAESIRRLPGPEDPAKVDLAALWFGSLVFWRESGDPRKEWIPRVKSDAIATTRAEPAEGKGTWDPAGPGFEALGRVGSTALAALAAQVWYRYSSTFGAR
jgi:hypothetical protein